MSSAQHDTFSPQNLAVLGGLLFVALFLGEFVFSRHNNADVAAMVPDTMEEITMRIKPVVALGDIMANASGGGGSGAGAVKTAKQMYEGACLACHASGVAGAPKVGDGPAWELRLTEGLDAIITSAINGKGAMPANGGSAYSAEEIRSVVEYMITESGL